MILCFFMHLKQPWLLRFFPEMLQKQFKFKIIGINKKKLDDKNIIALKQQLLGIILCFCIYIKCPWLLRFFAKMLQKQFRFKIIEICKTNLGDKNIIALKQQLVGIILCFFMHLKWPWLLRFFAKMLQKQFRFKTIEMIKFVQVTKT